MAGGELFNENVELLILISKATWSKVLKQLTILKNLTVPGVPFKKEFRILIKEEITGDFKEWHLSPSILQNTDCQTAALTSNSQNLVKVRK